MDNKSPQKFYTEEDMIAAAKYGYIFRNDTNFPEHAFDDAAINNFKSYMATLPCYCPPEPNVLHKRIRSDVSLIDSFHKHFKLVEGTHDEIDINADNRSLVDAILVAMEDHATKVLLANPRTAASIKFRFYKANSDEFMGAFAKGSLKDGNPIILFNMDAVLEHMVLHEPIEDRVETLTDAMLQIFMHEFGHAMQEYLGKEFTEDGVDNILDRFKPEWARNDETIIQKPEGYVDDKAAEKMPRPFALERAREFRQLNKGLMGYQYRHEMLKLDKEDIYDFLDNLHSDNVALWHRALYDCERNRNKFAIKFVSWLHEHKWAWSMQDSVNDYVYVKGNDRVTIKKTVTQLVKDFEVVYRAAYGKTLPELPASE